MFLDLALKILLFLITLQNYYEATRLEIDPYDRSYILYNIGLIHTTFNNMAVICHYVRLSPL
ncbi:Photosystem I assembly protein Ycf3 [Ranunculus cassubicifolius]